MIYATKLNFVTATIMTLYARDVISLLTMYICIIILRTVGGVGVYAQRLCLPRPGDLK